MTELPDLPILLTHGLVVFWTALALASLMGPLVAWSVARSGARRRAAAVRDRLGRPGGLQTTDGEASVLTGVLELVGSSGPLRGEPDGAVSMPPGVRAFLQVGEARVAVEGELELHAGTRERWGVPRPALADPPSSPAASGPDPSHPGPWRLAAHRIWLAPGQRVRARGVLQIVPAEGERSYREAAVRHVLAPGEGGRIALAAEGRPRVRLSVGSIVVPMLLFGGLFAGLSCGAGRIAADRTWDAASGDDGSPVDQAAVRRALRWGALGAAVPLHRERSLDGIAWALRLSQIDDPEAQRERVWQSASLERHRTGSCEDAVSWLRSGPASRAFVAEVGVACGDPASLRIAGWALLEMGEFDRAADLAARVARMDRSRPAAQVVLERSAHLLSGRLEQAAAVLREIQGRVDEFYEPSDEEADRAAWRTRFAARLGCAADQLAARAGSDAARTRLEAAAREASAADVRRTCGLLLADLAGGAGRLAVIHRIRRDPALAGAPELGLLEAEVDPARAHAESPGYHAGDGARILGGRALLLRPDPLEWSALERLAAAASLPPAALRARARLAARLAGEAAMLGDDARALAWAELAERDWKLLAAGRDEGSRAEIGAAQLDELAAQRGFIELRAGRTPALQPAPGRPTAGRRQEVEAVVAYLERGDLTGLHSPELSSLFSGASNPIHEGLVVAARGSGAELARWLDDDAGGLAGMTVALVGARRLRTGHREMLDWLRLASWSSLSSTMADRVVDVANRQKVAEALGASDVAAGHRAVAERLRRALLGRDTALVRKILLVD